MMIIEDQEHLDKVREFARSVGAEVELQKQLDFLAGFGGDGAKVRCHLYSDFATHSFFWRMEHSSSEGWKTSLVGGLIYSGPGAPSDGSAPSFSVSLNPDAATGSKQNGGRVEHQMDAATISALAASGAALVAATVAGVQFWMGRRQSEAALTSAKAALMNAESAGRHTVAEFRQKWIDKVIDTLCEHHSIIMTRPEGQPILLGDNKNLRSSRTKLEILLNPDEPNTVEFLKKIDDIDAAGTIQERDKSAAEMLTVARRLLKREWVRIKDELQ